MKMLTWLCAIAKNTYFTEVKKQLRYEVLEDDVISEDNIIDQIILKQDSSEILQIVNQLEEPYKKVFSLRMFGEYSFKQIDKNAYAAYTMDGSGNATVYVTAEQNLLSAFVTKCDESENFIGIGNDICVSYHNADRVMQFYLPENTRVKEVYYVEANQSMLQEFAEGNASEINSHLVWVNK